MAGPALRLYAEDHPALARTLRAKLEKRRIELGAQIIAGSVQDWPDFKQRYGVLLGLKEAIEICAEEEKSQDGDRG